MQVGSSGFPVSQPEVQHPSEAVHGIPGWSRKIPCLVVLFHGYDDFVMYNFDIIIWFPHGICTVHQNKFVDDCWMNHYTVLYSICYPFCYCKLFDISYSNKVILNLNLNILTDMHEQMPKMEQMLEMLIHFASTDMTKSLISWIILILSTFCCRHAGW